MDLAQIVWSVTVVTNLGQIATEQACKFCLVSNSCYGPVTDLAQIVWSITVVTDLGQTATVNNLASFVPVCPCYKLVEKLRIFMAEDV